MLTIAACIAAELYRVNANERASGFTKIKDQYASTSRWHEHREVIFYHHEYESYHAIEYKLGLTEYQDDEFPWMGVDDYAQIKCPKVIPRERTYVEYVSPDKF